MAADSGSGRKSSGKKGGRKHSPKSKGSSKKPTTSAEPVAYTYRGKSIMHEPAAEEGMAGELTVDGRAVHYERTSEGVTSHAFMYMVFGSPFELAEELIRQWGESGVEPRRSDPDAGGHGHRHRSED